MLAHVLLLALIGSSISLEIKTVMPFRYQIKNSINHTIKEVEKLIQENPSLPKLQRTDIINILFNLTSEDTPSIEEDSLEALQKMRTNYQRALMVVLPYKLKNSENLKDIVLKSPIIQILGDEKVDPNKDSKNHKEFTYNSSLDLRNNIQETENSIKIFKKIKNSTKINFQEIVTMKIKPESQKLDSNLDFIDQEAEASHTSIATKRPINKGTFSRYRTSTQTSSKSRTTYTSIVTSKPTIHTNIGKTTMQNKSTQNVLSSDQWNYFTSPITPSQYIKSISDNLSWKPMSSPNHTFSPSTQSSFIDVGVSASITSTPVFVTPSIEINQKFNIKTNPNEFMIMTSTIKPMPMSKELELLSKSFGLQSIMPAKQQNNSQTIKNHIRLQLNSDSDVKVKNSKMKTTNNLFNTLQNNSFHVPSLVIKDDTKNLSPDIQLLFQQFGLQVPGQKKISTTSKPLTTANINSYTRFKPVPTSSVKNKEFRNFLAKFGLATGDNRNDKAIQAKSTTKRPSLIDIIPDQMKSILENIGLIKKSQIVKSTLKQGTEIFKIVEQTTMSSEHIFKPYEKTVEDKEQNEKIKNLLSTVKMVQQGRANAQDIQDIANDILQNAKSFENGPDPLKLEEILNNYRNNLKNEVKRHQEQHSVTTTTVTIPAPTTENLDESTISFMATTDIFNSSLDVIKFSTPVKNAPKQLKTDDLSLLSTDEKKIKPSFFNTFDISEYLNKTDSDKSTITTASSEVNTKPNFFNTFDINDHINKTIDEDSIKNVNASLSDLEASFGSITVEPDPVIPTRPKTGIYFLVDWNTFLDVGEEGKEKVNLRFSPKVGDSTRFISVKMP